MNKTLKRALLCVAFVVCLIVAMIPIMSIRTNAEPASINFFINSAPRPVERGATRCYTTDASGTLTEIAATSEDYNIKITYPADGTPIMYLKGAYVKNLSNNEASITADNTASKMTIVVEKTATGTVTVGSSTIAADSYIGTLLQWKGGDLVFEGRNDSKLHVATTTTMINQSVTYKDLNLEIVAGTAFAATPTGESATMVTFNGGTANIQTSYLGCNFTNGGDGVNGFTITNDAEVDWSCTNQVFYAPSCPNFKIRVESGALYARATTLGKPVASNLPSSSNGILVVNGGVVELTTPTGTGAGSLGFGLITVSNYQNENGDKLYHVVSGSDADNVSTHNLGGTMSGKQFFRIEPAYSVSVTDGTASVTSAPVGATVTLTPGAVAGKVFDGWSSSDVTIAENEGVYSFTMPAKNVAVTANFIKRAAVKLDGVEYTFSDTNSRYFTTNAAGEITEDGTVDAYNIKLAYNGDMPTVYLKNAFIAADADAIDNHTGNALTINVEAASRITHANAATNTAIENAGTGAAIKTAGNITITGSGLLTTESKNRSGNIIRVTSAFASGTIVKFENANIEFNAPDSKAWNEEGFRGNPAKYVFDGGKVTINTGYLNILSNGAATVVEIINGAEVNANSTGSGFIYIPTGSVVIDGGKLKIDGYNAISSLTKLEIKSGTMEAIVATGNISTLTPDLTAYTNAYAVLGASKAEATQYTGGALTGKYFKIDSTDNVYTVTVTDGADSYDIKAFAGDTVTLNPNVPSGLTLAGWDVTAGGVTVNGASFIMPANDVALKAVYGVAGSITIGSTEYTAIKGGAAIYFKTDANGVVTVAGDENDYNLKLVYADEEGAVPTLYLKGAKVDAAIESNAFSAGTTKIVTETDSTVTGAITWSTGELIISGSGKLSLTKRITTKGANLTFLNANVEQKIDDIGLDGGNVTFNGGKFVFESTKTYISDWTSNARTFLVKNGAVVELTATESPALTIVNANAKLIVEGGYLKLYSPGTSTVDGLGNALRLSVSAQFKVSGGVVEMIGGEYATYYDNLPVDVSDYDSVYVAQEDMNSGIVEEITNGTLTHGINGKYTAHRIKISAAYTVTVNGATANREKAAVGDEVILKPERIAGKKLDSWTVDNGSAAVTITDNKFIMPAGNVIITANYVDDPNYDGEPDEVGFWFGSFKQLVTRGEGPYYLITDASGAVTDAGANEDNYNIKIEYELVKGKTPVITLRGAYIKGTYSAIYNNNQSSGNFTDDQRASKVTIVIEKELGNAVSAVPADVTADTYIESRIFLTKGSIEVQGPGKLAINKVNFVAGGVDKTTNGVIYAGADLTFTNADVLMLNGSLSGKNITFDGGKFHFEGDKALIADWGTAVDSVLVKNDAQLTAISANEPALILGNPNCVFQVDSGNVKLVSNGVYDQNARDETGERNPTDGFGHTLRGAATYKINGGTFEVIGNHYTVYGGGVKIDLSGYTNYSATCASNGNGTGAVAYTNTEKLTQYNSSFAIKYFKVELGNGDSGNTDSGNTGTGTGTTTHKHSRSTTTKVTGKAASCTADGVKDYYKCSCGKFFEDKAAKKEIKDIDTWKVIKATGHKDTNKDGICETCKKSAQTSDSSFTALWITLLTVSAMGMCVTFVYNKKMKATK